MFTEFLLNSFTIFFISVVIFLGVISGKLGGEVFINKKRKTIYFLLSLMLLLAVKGRVNQFCYFIEIKYLISDYFKECENAHRGVNICISFDAPDSHSVLIIYDSGDWSDLENGNDKSYWSKFKEERGIGDSLYSEHIFGNFYKISFVSDNH